MKNRNTNKYIAAIMATAMLSVPAVDAIAKDSFLDKQKDFDINPEKAVEIESKGESSKKTTGDHVITLITGDVVTVSSVADGKSVISIEYANQVDSGAQILTLGEDTYVIPTQAMPYLASGLLDDNLFNVTALIAAGYDDGAQSGLPVIVQYAPTKASFEEALPATLSGSERTNVLESISGVALTADKEQVTSFWDDITQNVTAASTQKAGAQSNGVIEKVWLDGRVEANLEQSVPQIGAPTAWDAGLDGEGVKIAVLDSGIDAEHPDVADRLEKAVSFVPGEDVLDYSGHGTHVAATALGTGAASQGRNKGVAPGADLLVGKVLNSYGIGQDSWVIEGMEWAAENAKVVNMSLGNPTPSDGTDPLSQAVNELSEQTGALFVISSGNSGGEGIGAPGAADAALTVGNVDKSDKLNSTSTKGPRFMDSGLKPDLVAPGQFITAARSQYSSQGTGSYISMTGTSMAAPHVAGAAAILSQRYPEWTGEQLKNALMSSTKKLDHIKPYEGGSGRLDVAAATSNTIFAGGSLDFGLYTWPHDGDDPVEKTVTYTNESDSPVTLELSTTFKDASGADAPDGLVELSSNEVTVPAKGSAEVFVTVDPESGVVGSRYQGQLTAIVGGQTVAHTAMVMGKEVERYPLVINATDRDGTPAEAVVTLVGPNGLAEYLYVVGKEELRLPPGTYSVMSFMDVDKNTDHTGVAILGNPEFNLDAPTTIELDARNAQEITANVPDKTEANYRKLEFYRNMSPGSIVGQYQVPPTIDKMYAEPTAAITKGKLDVNTRWRLVKPITTITHGETELDIITQPGSTFLEGKHQLAAVYVGYGAPKDYDGLDVKDKVVLVKRSDKFSGSARAEAAYAAGAKLVITVNDSPTEFNEWVGKEDGSGDIPIAVVAVSGTEGEKLIKAAGSGEITLNIEGTPHSPYVYDLVDDHQNVIPKDLSYSPTEKELVKIDAQYYSDHDAAGSEFRYDIPPYAGFGIGVQYKLPLPSVRTEWVSATKGGTTWYHQARVLNEWEVRQPAVIYQPGQRLNEKWFAPVVRPRFGADNFWVPARFGNDFQFNVPAIADSGVGHTGAEISRIEKQQLKLYKGTELVEQAQGQMLLYDDAPEAKTQYRLESVVARDSERWNTSVRTHTAWTIWSEKTARYEAELPMISLDYKVDTDMLGKAPAGDTITLGLSASQIDGAVGKGKMEGAALEVSYNEGETWEKVDVVREGTGWTADIPNPRKSGTYVSLRASAWDDLGNRIDQDVIKAFGISDSVVVDSAIIRALVERFEREGEFKNAQAARALKTHLTAVAQYEKQEAGDKVMKHMKGFKVLLDQQKESKLISDKAYNELMASADEMIKNLK
ncbi:S8 family serine peptidase [Sporosarcina sp. NPDC096371]|uniref:S8 family serine peptidase n=1 Tax=Sporosarcina sp. NPDC096371 TaxID=3364530 RepID=UPI0038005348